MEIILLVWGAYINKDDTSVVANQLWPGATPVDAVKNATINGVIDNHLEGKMFQQRKRRSDILSCSL
jgi:hypothetical protein